MHLKKYLAFLQWLPHYKHSYLKGDFSAGIIVGIMLVPQGMAYAMLAGLNPIHGLYAVTLPLLIYAIFGSSRQLAVGPGAMVSLLVAAGIGSLNTTGYTSYLNNTLTLAFMVGLIQLSMGLFRLGFIVNFLSQPVIKGFTSAAAVIIGVGQMKHLLKLDLPNSNHIQDILNGLFSSIDQTHWMTFGIGIGGVIVIKYARKIHRSAPGSLIAVVLGITLVEVLQLTDFGVLTLGKVPQGLPELSLPTFDLSTWADLFPIALTISLIGIAESFSIGKTIQSKHKNYKISANQELLALGMANLSTSLVKGFPVTGGLSRTAVNDQSGAKTPMASVISSFLILLILLFFTDYFYYLPNAILAAVIIVAVTSIIDFKGATELWKKDRKDFYMFLATFLVTLTMGIVSGILSGIILSLMLVIYKASRPHMAQLGRVPGTNTFRNTNRFSDLEIHENLLLVRIDGPIYFANVDYINERINQWQNERGPAIKMIILNMESVTSLDSTGANALIDWVKNWRNDGVNLWIAGAKGPVRDTLKKWDIMGIVGEDHIFLDINTAITYYEKNVDAESVRKFDVYTLQNNIDKKQH
jgi:SulP family sulfate permease